MNFMGLTLQRFLGQDHNSQTFAENDQRQPAEYPFNCSLKPKSAEKRPETAVNFCVIFGNFSDF